MLLFHNLLVAAAPSAEQSIWDSEYAIFFWLVIVFLSVPMIVTAIEAADSIFSRSYSAEDSYNNSRLAKKDVLPVVKNAEIKFLLDKRNGLGAMLRQKIQEYCILLEKALHNPLNSKDDTKFYVKAVNDAEREIASFKKVFTYYSVTSIRSERLYLMAYLHTVKVSVKRRQNKQAVEQLNNLEKEAAKNDVLFAAMNLNEGQK